MAKISSYPSDANVTTSDRLIGSDNENSNETKNFQVGDIINLAASIILPQVAGSYVPYTGATSDVFLGSNELYANAGYFPTVFVTNISPNIGNPLIFIGGGVANGGLQIDTSANIYKLGDFNGNINGTNISIFDSQQQITFVGGFNVANGQGTVNDVLVSNGSGNTPLWSSSLIINSLTLNGQLAINSDISLNGNTGASGELMVSAGAGLPPTWQPISTAVQLPYLSAHSTVQQTALAANTGYAMKFNTIDLSNNISINADGLGNLTRITPVESGIYNIQFSAQIQRTTGGASATIDIWFRQGGVDIPASNTSVNIQANAGYLVASWNFFTFIDVEAAGPYVEIMWATTDTAVSLQQQASNAVHPATPSVIVTVNKVSN